MPAATWDSAYLLALLNRLTGRPASDSITDASKYQRLSEAQNEIVGDIAGIIPRVLYPAVGYGSIPACSTTDNQTFTFGTDSNGYAVSPIGKVSIYTSLNDIPTNPWVANRDYIPIGTTAIQIPNNNTYSGTLYWRGITNPPDIDATHQPSLFPEASRELIAIRAAYNFAGEGNRNPDLAALMAVRYGAPLSVAPGRFAWWCLTWKTQFRSGGVLSQVTGAQVAVGSYTNMNAGL